MPTGVWYGITTNPLILQRCGVKCNFETLKKLALDAHALGAEELQLQTWGESVEDMVGNGQLLGAMGVGDMEIVVKVPITARGLTAASRLIEEGVPITMTGVYAPHQVVAAAAVGASYAAPYLGRMNDAGRDGMVSCMQMQEIIDNAGSEMRLLVASVRNLREVTELAAHGCNTFTLGAAVAEAMYADPLTNAAAAEFEQCARDGGAYD
ncbi:unnamed protein product [Pedinophyceae sp. YPF-701]|nr:unnamed protein product [Pedinophyceae sp. YPF-701]